MDKNKVFNASSWVEEDRIGSLPDDINTTLTPKIRNTKSESEYKHDSSSGSDEDRDQDSTDMCEKLYERYQKLILEKNEFVVKIEQQQDEILALKEQLNEKVEVVTMTTQTATEKLDSMLEEDRISSLPDDIITTFTPNIRNTKSESESDEDRDQDSTGMYVKLYERYQKLILEKNEFVVKIEQQQDEIVALKEQLNKKIGVETMSTQTAAEKLDPMLEIQEVVHGSPCVGEDRISRLSDDIIVNHILSLCPLKYSIRTGVLSKRWAYLWALSPKLVIDLDPYECPLELYKSFTKVSADTFTKSIDKLFSLRNGLYIDTFKLDTAKLIPSQIFDLRPWIGAIVMCSVREMDIKIPYNDYSDFREIPKCLFTCKTVEVLKLSGRFIMNVPDDVCLPNLKTLHLMLIVYPNDAMLPKLLSGCPVLEDLDIHRLEWDEMLVLNVAVSSLKRFTLYSISEEIYVHGSYAHDQCRIVVDSPNLEFIDMRVGWLDDTLLKPLPNVTEAHISTVTESLRDVSENKLIALLQSIVNVRHLYLSDDTINYYFFLEELDLPTFSNLVRLEISYQYPYGILMKMLRSSPNLETLCLLTMGSFDGVNIDDFDDDPGRVPECLCRSLKTVELQCLQGEEIELKIVKYFLGNAKVLEKMVIYWDPNYEDEFVEFETELRNYPMLSKNCQLDLILED